MFFRVELFWLTSTLYIMQLLPSFFCYRFALTVSPYPLCWSYIFCRCPHDPNFSQLICVWINKNSYPFLRAQKLFFLGNFVFISFVQLNRESVERIWSILVGDFLTDWLYFISKLLGSSNNEIFSSNQSHILKWPWVHYPSIKPNDPTIFRHCFKLFYTACQIIDFVNLRFNRCQHCWRTYLIKWWYYDVLNFVRMWLIRKIYMYTGLCLYCSLHIYQTWLPGISSCFLYCLFVSLFVWRHINLCRIFNAKPISKQINSSISNNSV